jgi:ER-derived vesicles protein
MTAGNSAPLPSLPRLFSPAFSFLLAGRVLLIFLFLGFIFQGEWNIGRAFLSLFGLIACIMVAVGFKAKWSASFLVITLSIFNVAVNNWWSVHSAHPTRDFLKCVPVLPPPNRASILLYARRFPFITHHIDV